MGTRDAHDVRDTGEEQREWMSPTEVAEWLGLARSKVYDLIYRGCFKSYKIGKRRLIRRSDLLAYIESQAYEPADEIGEHRA